MAGSGAFRPNPAQVTAHFVYIRSKRATGSGAFRKNKETRHCQWRAAIRIFENLLFSLLFLIILIY
jgi:hypothetical protein